MDQLEKQGVVSRADQPTDWCAPIVVVPNLRSGDVRLCVGLTKLNKQVKRERLVLPAVDDVLAQQANSKYRYCHYKKTTTFYCQYFSYINS